MPQPHLPFSALPSPSQPRKTPASWSIKSPPEVSEIASGGHWSADGKGGFYRAFVVMAEENGGTAEVYLQWVSFGDGKPAVVKSLPVKEVNDQKLGNAPITIGGEDDKENETPSSSAPTTSTRTRTFRSS